MVPTARPLAAFLLLLLALGPSAQAHAGSAIELLAKDGPDCVARDVCLELFSIPPDLQIAHAYDLTLRNHPNSTSDYRALATAPDAADPQHSDTQAEDAIASTDPVAPGSRASTPVRLPDAGSLYVWLEDEESKGGWAEVPIQAASSADANARTLPAPSGLLALALAAVVLAASRGPRTAW